MTSPKPEGWGKPRKRTHKETKAQNAAAIAAREFFERMLFGGKLRKDAMDGIDYESPELQELKIELALRLDDDFGLDQEQYDAFHARAKAGADQHLAAFVDASRWTGTYTGTQQRWPDLLGFSPEIRRHVGAVMADYRALGDTVDYVEIRRPNRRNSICLTPFDPDDPSHYRGVFGLVAGVPGTVYVLRDGEGIERWLNGQSSHRERPCRWATDGCFEFTAGETLVFARGQFLVAVPTCYACMQELTRGFSTDQYQ